MSGFHTRQIIVDVDGDAFRLRVLADLMQFSDPDGHGARMGISSAQWSLFGQVWPAGRLLADTMGRVDIAGKRILEIGCGIGLASLVLMRRGADVVASDVHPLTEGFLAYNAALNGLPALHYRHMRWDEALPTLGDFDMIIASDVLYERDHAELVAGVVSRHARPRAEVFVTDPGRGNSGMFTRLLASHGFDVRESHPAMEGDDGETRRGRLLHYRRGTARSVA